MLENNNDARRKVVLPKNSPPEDIFNSKTLKKNDLENDMWKEVFGPLVNYESKLQEMRSWKGKNGKRNVEETIIIEGTINPQFRDTNGVRVKIGKYVVTGMSLRTNAFTYKVTAIDTRKTFFNLPLALAKDVVATPLPLTGKILKEMLMRNECETKMVENFLKENKIEVDNQVIKDVSSIKKALKQSQTNLMVRFSDELKRFFLHKEDQILLKFYPDDKDHLYTMGWQAIEQLYEVLMTSPASLCCSGLYTFHWQVEDPDTGKIELGDPSFKSVVPIIELELKQLEVEDCPLTNVERSWIKIYKYIKNEYYGNKHSFVHSMLIENLLTGVYPIEDIRTAISFLVQNKVIFRDAETEYVYLRKPYLHEKMISYTIAELYKRQVDNIPDSMSLEDANDLRWVLLNMENKDLEEGLCDEQVRALRLFYEKPLCTISGPGGSGKTHTLQKIIRNNAKGGKVLKTCVTAFQNKNVGHLARMTPELKIYFNTHQLLAAHSRCCSISPFKNSKQGKMDKTLNVSFDKCIFEDVEILVIDEAGLEYPEIMARLFFSLINCSKVFRKIVLSGDYYQLPSINPGNFLYDIKKICETHFDSSIEFLHNHRAEFDILFQNANAIKNHRPEDIKFDNLRSFIIPFPRQDEFLRSTIVDLAQKYNLTRNTAHFITYTNDLKEKINGWLECHYLGISLTDYKPHVFYPGSKIIIKKNDASSDIFNNEILIIKSIYDVSPMPGQPHLAVSNTSAYLPSDVERYMVCNTMPGTEKTIVLDKETKKCMQKAYATTTYSFIGDQADDIVCLIPPWNKRETDRTTYTNFTRTLKRFFLIGSIESLSAAVLEEEPLRDSSIHVHVAKDMIEAKKYVVDALAIKNPVIVRPPRKQEQPSEMQLDASVIDLLGPSSPVPRIIYPPTENDQDAVRENKQSENAKKRKREDAPITHMEEVSIQVEEKPSKKQDTTGPRRTPRIVISNSTRKVKDEPPSSLPELESFLDSSQI